MKKVLIIDDEEKDLEVIGNYLDNMGLKWIPCSNPLHALDKLME